MGDVTNIERTFVEITLDKPRKLFLGMRGLAGLAKKYGSVQNALKKLADPRMQEMTEDGLELILDLLVACLVHEDKDVTQDGLLDYIDIMKVREIMEKLTLAVISNMPKPDKNPQKA